MASIDLGDELGRDGDLDLQLGQEADGIFGATVDFRMALLAAVALDLGHGQAVHAEGCQRVADLVELERLNNRNHDFHDSIPLTLPHRLDAARLAVARSRRCLHRAGRTCRGR